MWNYPFDPEEIEGDDNESNFAEAGWIYAIGLLVTACVLYYGGHLVMFILK